MSQEILIKEVYNLLHMKVMRMVMMKALFLEPEDLSYMVDNQIKKKILIKYNHNKW